VSQELSSSIRTKVAFPYRTSKSSLTPQTVTASPFKEIRHSSSHFRMNFWCKEATVYVSRKQIQRVRVEMIRSHPSVKKDQNEDNHRRQPIYDPRQQQSSIQTKYEFTTRTAIGQGHQFNPLLSSRSNQFETFTTRSTRAEE
jgi:hypothetical protein